MRIRDTGALALHLLLALTMLLAATGHDHVGRPDQDAGPCVVDHDAAHEGQQQSSVPRLSHGAEEHEHECLGCRLGSQRWSLAKPQLTGSSLLVAQAARFPDTSPRSLLLPSSRTNRGPPAS